MTQEGKEYGRGLHRTRDLALHNLGQRPLAKQMKDYIRLNFGLITFRVSQNAGE